MGNRADAVEILRDAETAIQKLIEAAAREQRYGDVSELADTAGELAALLTRKGNGRSEGVEPLPVSGSRSTKTQLASRSTRRTAPPPKRRSKTEYPRFERDGERLVKIGWSKKNREEYEHRASKQAVIAVARHMSENARPGELFALEDLLPISDRSNGEEIPTYQVYLISAWFRSVDVMQKRGRDGYVLLGQGVDELGIQILWEQLTVREK